MVFLHCFFFVILNLLAGEPQVDLSFKFSEYVQESG